MADASFEGAPRRQAGGGVASPLPRVPHHHHVVYRGGTGPVFRIALVNSLLSLVTLGIYRFWARTRLRRYFWSHVELDGDPIEYTGTGKQLFLGFLIVMAILVPLLFGLEYVATFFPQEAWQQLVIALVQAFGFLVLIQYAVFRARRYRLRHTLWRGIRCNQTGSGRRYALRAFGYLMLTFLTLGLTYPLFRVKTQSYLMKHTCIGSQAFAFDGRAGPLFGKWLLFWIVSIVAFVAAFLGEAVVLGFMEGYRGTPESASQIPFASLGPGNIVVVIVTGLTALLLYAWYRAREFRYFAEVTRFGPLRFASAIKARRVVLVYAVFYAVLAAAAGILFFVLSGFIAGFEDGLLGSLEGTHAQQLQQVRVISVVLALVALLFAATLVGTLQPVFVTHPLARHVIATLTLKGQYGMDELLQGAKMADRRGEGLADALDVDVAGF